MFSFIFFAFFYSTILTIYANAQGDTVTHVQAIISGTALLPCDLTPPVINDSVILIVWYKNQHTPIYSYDTRRSKDLGTHWQDEHLLESRATFQTFPEPSTLSIDNISEADEGEYRCRIDYLRSPTKNIRVKLSVIVPPQKPTIIDDHDKEVIKEAGPYVEGADVKLTCIVSGGKPNPSIKWWRGEVLIDSLETKTGYQEDVKSSQLVLRNLQRSDQHAMFTCQASNNNISQPVSTSIIIVVYSPPASVEIQGSNHPFSADKKYEIPCQAIGSRPPAKISWWMENEELFNHTQNDSIDGNTSTSIINLVLRREDNGKSLTCRANNEHLHGGVEEATVKLNVLYIPRLNITLGSSLNPDDIEEGDDVYFVCKVNANPWAYKVVWKHNGQIIQHNPKAGIIISSSDLALQGVTRHLAGNYSCTASNVEGDGDSDIAQLKIMYKPLCRIDQKRIYGVARHENASVSCEVDSYPPPLTFKWSFNNTAETIDVPQTRYKSEPDYTKSVLMYTPLSELDYGTVMCWAENNAGRQLEPCVFHIMAAGKPDPPYNCSIFNQTNQSVEVECMEGFDGGQLQHFILEIYEQETSILQANVSAKYPLFTVSGLESGKLLKMFIYAANSKGRSESVLFQEFSLKVAEKHTGADGSFVGVQTNNKLTPVLGIVIGIVTALILFVLLILIILKIRLNKTGTRPNRPNMINSKEKVIVPLRLNTENIFEKDERNPDVVPSNKDSDYQLSCTAQTIGYNTVVEQANFNTIPAHKSIIPTTFMSRDRQPDKTEVQYAELCLARPNILETVNTCGRLKDDSVIYSHIDHVISLPTDTSLYNSKNNSITNTPLSPSSGFYPTFKPVTYHKEIVTVRTPLMGCQQESCV